MRMWCRKRTWKCCAARLLASIAALSGTIGAQPASTASLTLAQAVQDALRTYPSVTVSAEQLNAAAARIQLARTAYLPRVDALAQVNRATRNNIFGMLLPQSVLPNISGPPLNSNNFGTVWGSAAGVLVSWEPFDFGLRSANVAIAGAARDRSEAGLRRTQFEVAVTAADAYLTLVAAQQTVRAAQAGVERAETMLRTTRALSDAQLRPGADASRAEAELAAARTQLIQAEQAVEVARATLAQFIGGDPTQISVAAPRLLELPPDGSPVPLDPAANTSAAEQNSVIAQTQAELRALQRSYFPRINAQAAAYTRGTGAANDGSRLGGFNGLAPNYQNYAVGLTMTFPLFDLPAIRARQGERSAAIRAETARYNQIATDLRAQWNRAVATLTGSRRVAANTPVQIAAAQTTVRQATARYEAELGTIDQVADAQRLLTQAEIDDVLARLSVWRGLLAVAAAAGDVQPFLAEAGQ
jgi:outer membrane protein